MPLPRTVARNLTQREERAVAKGSGTKADPWMLKTPPGTSEYMMWID